MLSLLTDARRVRPTLLLIAVLAVFPGSAHAAFSLTSANGAPIPMLNAWAAASHAPLPPGPVVIHTGRCPDDRARSCAIRDTPDVWLGAEAPYLRFDFSHELGHQFDYLAMTKPARLAFKALIHRYGPWRTSYGPSLHETFAEAYGLCFRKRTIRVKAELGHGYTATPRLHRRVCRLIRLTAAGLPPD